MLCLAIGVALRWPGLGREPLTIAEASHAWRAWVGATGGTWLSAFDVQAPASALQFALHSLVFWLGGGGGDAAARVPSAVAGSLTVAIPWLLREAIGRPAALALAALLAHDPVMVRLGRTADGGVFTSAAALLTIACLLRATVRPPDTVEGAGLCDRWVLGAAVAAGLLMVSGPHAWSFALLGAVAALARRSAIRDRLAGSRPGRRVAASALGAALVTALLSATALLTHWTGAGYVAGGATAWAAQWPAVGDVADAVPEILRRLSIEQPLLVALVIAAVVLGNPRDRRLLAALAAIAIALACGAEGPPANRLPLTVVLMFSAALVVEPLVKLGPPPLRRLLVGMLVVLALATTREAVRGALVVDAAAGGREAVTDGARRLAHHVGTLGAWRVGDAGEHPVHVVATPWPDPVLGWYLRHSPRTRWILAPAATTAGSPLSPIVITSADAPPPLPGRYAGTRYRIREGGAGADTVVLWVHAWDR